MVEIYQEEQDLQDVEGEETLKQGDVLLNSNEVGGGGDENEEVAELRGDWAVYLAAVSGSFLAGHELSPDYSHSEKSNGDELQDSAAQLESGEVQRPENRVAKFARVKLANFTKNEGLKLMHERALRSLAEVRKNYKYRTSCRKVTSSSSACSRRRNTLSEEKMEAAKEACPNVDTPIIEFIYDKFFDEFKKTQFAEDLGPEKVDMFVQIVVYGLAAIESKYEPKACSKGREKSVNAKCLALGIWQFIEKTGKRMGLRIGDEVDERMHVEKSTRAAARYFGDRIYKKLKDSVEKLDEKYGPFASEDLLFFLMINSYFTGSGKPMPDDEKEALAASYRDKNVLEKAHDNSRITPDEYERRETIRKKLLKRKINPNSKGGILRMIDWFMVSFSKEEVEKEVGEPLGKNLYDFMAEKYAEASKVSGCAIGNDYGEKGSRIYVSKVLGAYLGMMGGEKFDVKQLFDVDQLVAPLDKEEESVGGIRSGVFVKITAVVLMFSLIGQRWVGKMPEETRRKFFIQTIIDMFGFAAAGVVADEISDDKGQEITGKTSQEEVTKNIPQNVHLQNESPQMSEQDLKMQDFKNKILAEYDYVKTGFEKRFRLRVSSLTRNERRTLNANINDKQAAGAQRTYCKDQGLESFKVNNDADLGRKIRSNPDLFDKLPKKGYVDVRGVGNLEPGGVKNNIIFMYTFPSSYDVMKLMSYEVNKKLHLAGMPEKYLVRPIVTGMYRTADYQEELSGVNPTATTKDFSPHECGNTFDVTRSKVSVLNTETGKVFTIIGGGMNDDHGFLEKYNTVFAKVMLSLMKKEGERDPLIFGIYEKGQNCHHICTRTGKEGTSEHVDGLEHL